MKGSEHSDPRCNLRVRWDGHLEAHCYCYDEDDGQEISIWAAAFPYVGIDGLSVQADTPAMLKLIEKG